MPFLVATRYLLHFATGKRTKSVRKVDGGGRLGQNWPEIAAKPASKRHIFRYKGGLSPKWVTPYSVRKYPQLASPNVPERRKGLNRKRLFILRCDDFGIRFHPAQGLDVGEALGFFAVDANDLLYVSGNALDIASQFILVGMAGIRID